MSLNIYKSRSYIIRCILVAILCCWFGSSALAQDKVKVGEFDCRELGRVETKVFFIEHLQDNGYSVEVGSKENILDIYAPVSMQNGFADFIRQVYDEAFAFSKGSKEEKAMYFAEHFFNIPKNVYDAIKSPRIIKSDDNENTTCEAALPFCTDNGLYTFYPNVGAGYICDWDCEEPYDNCPNNSFSHNGSTYDGIASAPDPAFYYLLIGEPGNLDIHIIGTTTDGDNLDVDFVCWGPFSSIDDMCNLSCDNMVDASFHSTYDEHCYINGAQTGQYYMLLLTNFLDENGFYTFQNEGTGTTDCGIMATTSSNSPICVGETLEFHANSQAGATFHWSGPNGWTSTQQNPTRPNATVAMSGTYSVYAEKDGETSETTYLEVEVLNPPVANFTMSETTNVCIGETVNFTDASTTPANGGTISEWTWDFGDGSTSDTQNATHAYYSGGTYTVTLTVSNGACERTKTQNITIISERTTEETASACDSYTWHGVTYTQSGNYTDTISGGVVVPAPVEKCMTETFEGVTAANYSSSTGNLPDGWVGFGNYKPGVSSNAVATYDPMPASNTSNYLYMIGSSSGTTPYTIMPKYNNITSVSFKCAIESTNYKKLVVGYVTSNDDYNTFQALRTINFTAATTIQTINLTAAEINTINNNNGYITFRWNETGFYSVGIDDVTVCYMDVPDAVPECLETTTLHLTINKATHNVETITECDSYTWHGNTYTETGTYHYDYTNSNGCPSSDTLHLTINSSDEQTFTETACDSYLWHGTNYDQSGNYTWQGTTAQGCQIVEHLNLTINDSETETYTQTACDSYSWHGTIYDQSGTYTWQGTTAQGCQRTETLNLTINNSEAETFNITECDSYTWHGTTYTQSGTYTFNTNTAAGCPRTETLNLTINSSEAETYTQTACDSYSWHGTIYDQSGTYTWQGTTAQGCQRDETLNLTINNSESETFNITECDSYIWHGTTYTQSGTYNFNTNTAAGCPRTETLNLTINNSEAETVNITECDSYTWHGTTYNTGGTYTYNTTTAQGCQRTETLNLTINNSETETFTETECDNYTWHGTNYTTSGTYTYNTTTAAGCPRTETLNLTINNSNHNGSVTEETCDSFTWNGINYTQSGDYTYNTQTVLGCDSTATLHLTINNSNHNGSVTEESCDSFTWHGTTYTQSGNYPYSTQTVHGCDSTATLHLTINKSKTFEFNAEACNNYTWDGTNYNATGDYTKSYNTVHGCDSTVTLHLVIDNSVDNEFSITECDSYTWDGTTYTSSNDYVKQYFTEDGCDSTVTLHLTINYQDQSTTDITECDSYTWNGQTYTESGIYTFQTQTVHGCDSLATLNLTINYQDQSTTDITECDSYTWNGQTYTQSGIYTFPTQTVLGCDSLATLNLTINYQDQSTTDVTECDSYTWNGQTYTESGIYTFPTQTVLGCDSLATLNLTINNSEYPVETVSACDTYTWHETEYTNSGSYTFETTTADGCTRIETLNLTIDHSEYPDETVTVCDSYEWNGMTLTTSDTYTYETTTSAGCQRIETLYLTVNHSDESTTEMSECDSFFWNGINYTQSGQYEYHTQTVHGCDSVAHLNLTINNSEYPVETVKYCDNYLWNGQEYTSTGTYTYETVTEAGCERIETLNLTIVETPDIIIEGDHFPVGGSETNFSVYNYEIIPQNTSTVFDSVTWSLDNLNWYIETHDNGMNADVHIFTWLPDTLLLLATAYNECGSYTYTFWIRTSYYGVNDIEDSHISITPNPNKGSMEIHLDNMSGKTEVQVYDINGKRIDSFMIDEGIKVYPYEMKTKAIGVYNFVISNGSATITKRVVISK